MVYVEIFVTVNCGAGGSVLNIRSLRLRIVTIIPSPAVNSNKNLNIYQIFIHFYNC